MNDEVLSQLQNNKNFIAKQEEKLDEIVMRKVQDKLDFMLQKYESVAQNFKKFFNSDELFRVLGEAVNHKQLLQVS